MRKLKDLYDTKDLYSTDLDTIREVESINNALKNILIAVRTDVLRKENYSSDVTCSNRQYEPLMIKDVIFNEPATIIKWSDGVKTVVKCQQGEPYDKEKGFAMAFMKRVCGNTGRYNELLHEWCDEEIIEETQSLEEVTE